MNHADHHRRQRSFDRAQRQYDNMSPPEDPRDGMDEPEAECEMEVAQEKAERRADRAKDERKERELDELREVFPASPGTGATLSNITVGRSCWYIESRTCPICGGRLATEGRVEWCVNVNSGLCKPPNEKGQP